MALEGTLQDMSMSDLFQVFRLGPKSGVLLLENDNERGVIYVDRGQLIDAFVVRGPERTVVSTSDEAVLYILDWDDANFVFRHDLSAAGRPVQIQHDSEWLVMESMRRRSDPFRALPYHQITLDTQLQLSPLPTNAESNVSLDVDQWRILSHAANNQNLRTICDITGIEHDKARRIVAELLSIGLVEVVTPAPATTSATAANGSSPVPQRAQTPSSSFDRDISGADQDKKAPVSSKGHPVGRNLLNAIMRRISEL
jgi:hypothetical protein